MSARRRGGEQLVGFSAKAVYFAPGKLICMAVKQIISTP